MLWRPQTRLKRSDVLARGRGVTAAQQTFNLQGEGSSPSDPNFGDKGDQRESVSDVRHPV
jgi:hypothetical protein